MCLSWQTCSYFIASICIYIKTLSLMPDNLWMAKWFSDTVRYIDDLLTLNKSNFEEEIPNICT